MSDMFKKHAEKIRFAIVGGANTALDFLILFGLTTLGMNAIAANYISTTVAFIFSFFVNKSFTFNHKGGNVWKQFIIFVAITIFGLWVIQPFIIIGVTHILTPLDWDASLVLFIAKLIATVASLIWNYILYSRLVFKKGTR